jgi:hypothetical protein
MSIEKLVVLDVLNSESSGWVEDQAALDKIPGCCREPRREIVFEIDNLLKREVLATSLERRATSQKLVYDATKCP